MKVKMNAATHALQQIATSDATPIKAAALPIQSRDDRLSGSLIAAEAMALARTTGSQWRALAWRLIHATTGARAVFLSAIRREKAALTKGQTDAGIHSTAAKARTASATVQVSRLTTIANAWNSGATIAGLIEYTNKGMPANRRMGPSVAEAEEYIGYSVIYEYAQLFGKSKAGRTADAWLVKCGKFLERNKPTDDDDKGLAQYEEILAVYNKLARAEQAVI